MKTTLKLHKESFVSHFLLPLGKLTDNVILNLTSDKVVATCSTPDAGVVVCAEYISEFDVDKSLTLNLPDVKKFSKLLDGLADEYITLTFNSNHLAYKSSSIKFNYFLLEEGYVQRCPVSSAKIQGLTHDSCFTLTSDKLNEILRGHSIASDASKVYFFLQDGEVYAELNDKERQNINNIMYSVTDEIEGEEFNTLALNLESLRMLTGLRNSKFKVKINNKLNVFLFDIIEEKINIRFAISALVK